MKRLAEAWPLAIVGVVVGGCAENSGAAQNAGPCRTVAAAVALADVHEASGLALGRSVPTRLWAHNDSGAPVLFALTLEGVVEKRVRVTGAEVDDWEDVSVGPCGDGSCLFVADIGDNRATRPNVTVYRVPEPDASQSATAEAQRLVFSYPDGPHDAEAAFVTRDGGLFIITKEKVATVYRAKGVGGAATTMLERVTTLPIDHATDADTSPDGQWLAIRTNNEMVFYRTQDVTSGNARDGIRVNLRGFKEPQGEGVTLDDRGDVYLSGEGAKAGTFLRLQCSLPR